MQMKRIVLSEQKKYSKVKPLRKKKMDDFTLNEDVRRRTRLYEKQGKVRKGGSKPVAQRRNALEQAAVGRVKDDTSGHATIVKTKFVGRVIASERAVGKQSEATTAKFQL
ncbi:hypothetical protein NE237_002714 [Protea cynaroides]|uniref:Uncharacterized protein n=1 Tax=Protea cynaroides TaxID=273540 RepID=A0A9Q0QRW8_9MAGN|nr:hypothetical protein NE237_002714 [Protea cynaroides]